MPGSPRQRKAPEGLAQPAALLPVVERRTLGKALRGKVMRESHAEWSPTTTRSDPVKILIASGQQRIPELLPIRFGRMAVSPFSFFRGAAAIMAADLAEGPVTGLNVQACGDCHLMNFGAYRSPEGTPVFDINDFDETLPAPFEWDVKRLAASIVLAGRDAGLSGKATAKAARDAVRAYREHLSELVVLTPLEAWRRTIDLKQAIDGIDDKRLRAREDRRLAEAMAADAAQTGLYRLTRLKRNAGWRIRDKKPLVHHFDTGHSDVHSMVARRAFASYRASLQEDRRVLLDRFRLKDVAFKVVGVGSVGTFCAIGLFMTADDEPLFLQIKEAQTSVLAPYAGASLYPNQGQRVVTGQRLLQATTDIFLGWTVDKKDPRHFYVRRLKERHLAMLGEELEEEALRFYAQLCGATLARAHARSGDAAMISGYLGATENFDAAIATFAVAYADQTDRDYKVFLAAIKAGKIAAKKV